MINVANCGIHFVDKVITPFANYIIVDYKDPNILKNPCSVDFFSGPKYFNMSKGREDLELNIMGFLESHPNLHINPEKGIRGYSPDILPCTVGYLLSQKNIKKAAKEFRSKDKALTAMVKKYKNCIYTDEPPTLAESERIVRERFINSAWNQLINKSSANHLIYDNKSAPFDLILDEEAGGFALIDMEMGIYSPSGTSRMHIYEILDITPNKRCPKGIFERETLTLKYRLESQIEKLHPSVAGDIGKLIDLRQKGKVILFHDCPSFVKLEAMRQKKSLRAKSESEIIDI